MGPLILLLALLANGEWVDLTWDTALAQDRAAYAGPLETALDQAVANATGTLHVKLSHAVRAHVYTRANYATRFGAARGAYYAAHYRDGMIHINGASNINRDFVALATHEMVHAVLDQRGRGTAFPAWFNEGIAEWARRRVLGDGPDSASFGPAPARGFLGNRPTGALPRARGLTPGQYVLSLAAVTYFVEAHGEPALLEIVRRVVDGAHFERAFASAAGEGPDAFERRFRAWAGAADTEPRRLRFK